jgi:hypothetical protein
MTTKRSMISGSQLTPGVEICNVCSIYNLIVRISSLSLILISSISPNNLKSTAKALILLALYACECSWHAMKPTALSTCPQHRGCAADHFLSLTFMIFFLNINLASLMSTI